MYLPADTRKLPTGGLGPRVLGYRNNAGPLSRTRCCDIPSLGLRGQTHSLHCSSVWFSQNVERNSLSLSLSLFLSFGSTNAPIQLSNVKLTWLCCLISRNLQPWLKKTKKISYMPDALPTPQTQTLKPQMSLHPQSLKL